MVRKGSPVRVRSWALHRPAIRRLVPSWPLP